MLRLKDAVAWLRAADNARRRNIMVVVVGAILLNEDIRKDYNGKMKD